MKDWIEIDDTNWEQVMDKVTTKREKELNKQLVSLKNIRNKEPQRQGKFLNKKLAIESLDEDTFEDVWYDDDWMIDDEDVDLEEDFTSSNLLNEGVSSDDKYLSMDYEKAMDSNWKHYIFSVETKDGNLHDERGSYSDDNSFNNAIAEIKRRYGNDLYSINAIHDKGTLKYYTDLYNRYLKNKNNNQQSLKNNNNSANSNISQNSNSTQNSQQQNDSQQAAKRKNNPIYKQRTKNNSKIVQAFKNNGLPTDKLTQQVTDKNGRVYTKATPVLKKLRKDLYGESLGEDLEKTSPYTNIKSNGIYSLNTGWVKHPVQQDIPDIDIEEFEKEFKVWEDKYFDLLDELDEQSDTINEVAEKQKELDLIKNKGVKNELEFIEINKDCPMIDFLNDIEDEKLKSKTIRNIYLLADLKNNARPPLSEYIGEGIFELRTKFSSNITRAFYFFIWGNKIIMTNGYIKKSQKLDKNEFNKAKKLMDNYLKSKANLKESKDKISTISIDDYLKDCLKNEEFREAWYSNDKEDVEKENKLEESISDNQSKLEKIDNLIEDIYDLRKQGMARNGEMDILNLIFKEFRNLGYLDNLKELRKEEISKELSLEQLHK